VGNRTDPLKVEFRNLRLRELPPAKEAKTPKQ
jgi:hypothetical protein